MIVRSKNQSATIGDEVIKHRTNLGIWFDVMEEVERNTKANLSWSFMGKKASVGRTPSFFQMIKHLRVKQKNGWDQYQQMPQNETKPVRRLVA